MPPGESGEGGEGEPPTAAANGVGDGDGVVGGGGASATDWPGAARGRNATEATARSRVRRHERELRERAAEVGAGERSTTDPPSAGTSAYRVDEGGRGLLRGGGDSGGVCDSTGTMSETSGIDPGQRSGVAGSASAADEGPNLTEAALEAHGHQHQRDRHDRAVAGGARERSLTYLPSASTSVDRVDEEGRSLLHRGGASGGVYDSMGTMSKMSGIDPSQHGGGGRDNIFRAAAGGSGGDDAPGLSLEASGSAGSFVRTASGDDGGDSIGGGGGGSGIVGGGGSAGGSAGGPPSRPRPPPRRPKPLKGQASRKVSWGAADASPDPSHLRKSAGGGDGGNGGGGGGEGRGGIPRPLPPREEVSLPRSLLPPSGAAAAAAPAAPASHRRGASFAGVFQSWGPADHPLDGGGGGASSSSRRPHRRNPSFADKMFRGLSATFKGIVRSSRNLAAEATVEEGDEEGGAGGGKESRGAKLWGVLHRRVESIVLLGDHRGGGDFDFDFAEVSLDEEDLAGLRAAGVSTSADGTVLETPRQIEERGLGDLLSSIRTKAKKERALEEARQLRRRFDVSVRECVLAIGAYLALSVLAYSFVFEGWPVVDSLYFAVVTFTTIGYGDLSPDTTHGRVFTCFFGLGGVASLGLALGVIGSDLVERRVDAANSAKEEAQEISRKEVLHLFDKDGDGEDEETEESSMSAAGDETADERTRLLESPTKRGEAGPGRMARCWRRVRPWSCSDKARVLVPLLAILLCGSVLIALMEGWTVLTGIYYAVVTSCTIGFGDFAPTLPSTRLFSVVFIPVAVAVMGEFLGAFSSYVMEERQKEFQRALSEVDLRMSTLEGMSGKGDGVVTRLDYVEFMLLVMNKVDRELLDELHAAFDGLDEVGDGVLTEADLKAMARRRLRSAKKKLELAEYKEDLLLKAGEKDVPPERRRHRTHRSLLEAVEKVL